MPATTRLLLTLPTFRTHGPRVQLKATKKNREAMDRQNQIVDIMTMQARK